MVCQRWCVKDGVWQSAATCRQVPRLPRKKPRRRWMSTAATQSAATCRQKAPRRHVRTQRATECPVPYVPRLPRETKVDVSKCHACHAKCSYMSPSATPATQKAAAVHTRLREVNPAARGNPACTRASPPYVPRLPRETKVDVSKCHACHAKCSYMSPSATPATQSAATCRQEQVV